MASEHQEFTAMLCKVCGTDQGVRELEVSYHAPGKIHKAGRTCLCGSCEDKVDRTMLVLKPAKLA